jgi:glycosyltransferase involved in cell wall biosynthesis
LGSSAPPDPFVSIVLTVRNEEPHIGRLLESLLAQSPPFEIVLVDALSRDRTWPLVQAFAAAHPQLIRAVRCRGSRGVGRNVGVALARGQRVAFIDGDCFADSGWLDALRQGFAESDVVAGRTVAVGSAQFGLLERVELFQRGSDVTYPSCNLGYRRDLFLALGGFDPRFVTAEDIDLNLRAVEKGATIRYAPGAIVYHQMRPNLVRFLYQAFWNGYGRKQLTEKHGSLWGNYRLRRLLGQQRKAVAWLRLAGALSGYAARVFTGVGRRLTDTVVPAELSGLAEPGGAPRPPGVGPSTGPSIGPRRG